MTDTAITELAPQVGVRAACEVLGAAQAGYYRRHRQSPPPQRPDPIGHRDRHQPRALSEAERQAILDQLHGDRFVDVSPTEVWATLLDEGVYLGSISTFYRLLRQAGQSRERRRQATHPGHRAPGAGRDRAEPRVVVGHHDVKRFRGAFRGRGRSADLGCGGHGGGQGAVELAGTALHPVRRRGKRCPFGLAGRRLLALLVGSMMIQRRVVAQAMGVRRARRPARHGARRGTRAGGVDFYSRRIDRARRTTHLLRQLHALGYQVQLTDTAA